MVLIFNSECHSEEVVSFFWRSVYIILNQNSFSVYLKLDAINFAYSLYVIFMLDFCWSLWGGGGDSELIQSIVHCTRSILMIDVWSPDEEFKFKNRYIHFHQFEIHVFAIKAAEKQENNKKICHIFHHNFKNIPCYVMSEVSLERFYFALFDDGLTLKTLKLVFIGFWIQTLQIFLIDYKLCPQLTLFSTFDCKSLCQSEGN